MLQEVKVKDVEIRICTACGEPMEREKFYRKSYDRTKLTSECKKCKKLRRKLYYEKNKKQVNKKHSNTYLKKHAEPYDIIKKLNGAFEKAGVNWLEWIREKHQERWGDWYEKYGIIRVKNTDKLLQRGRVEQA